MSSIARVNPAGQAPLEQLPTEMLLKILEFVILPDPNPNVSSKYSKYPLQSFVNRPVKPLPTLLPCLLSSKLLRTVSINITYRDITTSNPSTFSNFLSQLRRYPALGSFVRSLDLSSTRRSGDDGQLENSIPDLVHLTPSLRHFRARASFQQHLDQSALRALFCHLYQLETINLSGCNNADFAWEFMNMCSSTTFQVSSSITSLNLSGCRDLPLAVFQAVLPQLPRLRILNAEDTRITADVINRIPLTSRLTHLNINRCGFLRGEEIAAFLTSHPSVTSTLVSLEAETATGVPGLSEEDITAILCHAPRTLNSLNLKNSGMTSRHVPLLRKLTNQLEDLAVGSYLTLKDVESLFFRPAYIQSEEELEEENIAAVETKHQTVLKPLKQAVALCKLRGRIDCASPARLENCSRYLDISSMSIAEQGKLRSSLLLSTNLVVIEISEMVWSYYEILGRLCRAMGWDVRWEGRRIWLRRGA